VRFVPLTLPSGASSKARRHRVVGEAAGSNTWAGSRAVVGGGGCEAVGSVIGLSRLVMLDAMGGLFDMSEKWRARALHCSWGDHRVPWLFKRVEACCGWLAAAWSFLISFQTFFGRVERSRPATKCSHLDCLACRSAVVR